MSTNILDGDLVVRGRVVAQTFTPPAGSIGDAAMDSGNPLAPNKSKQQINQMVNQAHGTAATTDRRVIHRAYGNGTITAVYAGVVVACVGAATITVDLRKNGTTVLSGVITINNAIAAYAAVLGSVSSATYAAGDVLEVVITATAGGGTLGQGLFIQLICNENPT